ncbi:hypothetical protein [Paenibacillus wulumuqiensis]|uniref:hypothetical protein n=1 Tax=Paenibacillus wulumuqiensis TaxID=1567107 RepID=UPI000619D2CD|nr:hypothetical protein [Paenibacillus wulumuqiensis]
MMDWIFSNIYIVLIIGFAIFTAISSRSGKGKSNNRPSSMPTFGGQPRQGDRSARDAVPPLINDNGAEEAQRRYHEAQRRYNAPDTYESSESYEQDESWDNSSARPALESSRDHTSVRGESGELEGLSGRQAALDQRLKSLESNLKSRAGGLITGNNALKSSPEEPEAVQVSGEQVHADQLRQGMMWAEILGSPRSRQP